MEKDIEKLLKTLKSNPNKKVRSSMDAQTYLKHVKEGSKIDRVTQLQKEIEKDFGIKMNDTLDVSASSKFEAVESSLNQIVLGQSTFIHQLTLGFKRPLVAGHDLNQPLNQLLIIGKNEIKKILQRFVEYGYKQHVFSSSELFVIDFQKINDEKLFYQDFYEASKNQANVVCFEHLEKCPKGLMPVLKEFVTSGVLRLNKRYAVQKNQLIEAGQMLLNQSVGELTLKNKYCVFLSEQSVQGLSNIFGLPFIQSFQDVCVMQEINESTKKEIIQQQCDIFVQEISKRLNLTLEINDSFFNHLNSHSLDFLEKYLNQVFEAIVTVKLKENIQQPILRLSFTDEVIVEVDQKQQPLFTHVFQQETFEVKKELEAIVGLQEVKDYILSLEQNVLLQQRRRAQGLKTASVSMHMIFTGNPGTGKTTIARLISRYLKTMGVIQSGQLVEVTRADLVGQYVGHTAPLTTKVIESAIGGVLFIDEAYSLVRGKDDSFGLEAVDTLVKAMEDYRDQLIVILAGYSKEMKDFLEANSGLKSRFPNQIHFDDYTADELIAITKSIAKSKDYTIHEEAIKPLKQYYEQKQLENARENGNGRMARNCVESAILSQAKRCMSDPLALLDELRKEDFNL